MAGALISLILRMVETTITAYNISLWLQQHFEVLPGRTVTCTDSTWVNLSLYAVQSYVPESLSTTELMVKTGPLEGTKKPETKKETVVLGEGGVQSILNASPSNRTMESGNLGRAV